MTIKQFKLISNEEIICEVVDSGDTSQSQIVAKRILKVHVGEDYNNGIRYYSFKPWISFQDRINDFSVITTNHIVGQTTPSESLRKHYNSAVEEVERDEDRKQTYNLDELISDAGDIDPEDLEEFLRDKLDRDDKAAMFSTDSSSPNVINFDPKKTFH